MLLLLEKRERVKKFSLTSINKNPKVSSSEMNNFLISIQKWFPFLSSSGVTEHVGDFVGSMKTRHEKLAFANEYKIDLSNAAKCSPGMSKGDCVDQYKDVQDLFTRKISGIEISCPEEPGCLVSMADCKLVAFECEDDSRLWVKGKKWSVEQLVWGKPGMGQGHDWTLFVFRLAPNDYHRVHCPLDGVVTSIDLIGGRYYSVNPRNVNSDVNVFTDNQRAVVWAHNDNVGEFVMVFVGATLVGRPVLALNVGQEFKKGDEIGHFEFGGSTVILLFPRKAAEESAVEIDPAISERSIRKVESEVKVGQPVGQLL